MVLEYEDKDFGKVAKLSFCKIEDVRPKDWRQRMQTNNIKYYILWKFEICNLGMSQI